MDTRIIPCPACGGDRGHHDFGGRWHPCVACNATGDAEIEMEAIEMEDLEQSAIDQTNNRTCTCHPDDRPDPCPRRFATHHCWRAAVYAETREMLIEFKNRDRSPAEQQTLNYLMRVDRALDGTF
jgi:hypothetical protein